MTEPLTERELEIMTDRRAAAEIRKLRENLDKHRQVRDDAIKMYPMATKIIKNLQDDNADLKRKLEATTEWLLGPEIKSLEQHTETSK